MGKDELMNGLQIFGVKDIKVKQDSNFDSFATITVTVTDGDNKHFQLQLFTDKDFVPNMEVEYVND
tara:strand:+ start:245 stop:442 length:198 start_codon:yes stop_codon:yes gene_type:complete